MSAYTSPDTPFEQRWEATVQAAQDAASLAGHSFGLFDPIKRTCLWTPRDLAEGAGVHPDESDCAACVQRLREEGLTDWTIIRKRSAVMHCRSLGRLKDGERLCLVLPSAGGSPSDRLEAAVRLLQGTVRCDNRIHLLRGQWAQVNDHLARSVNLVDSFWQLARGERNGGGSMAERMARRLLESVLEQTDFDGGALYLANGSKHGRSLVVCHPESFQSCLGNSAKTEDLLRSIQEANRGEWRAVEECAELKVPCVQGSDAKSVFLAPLSPPANGPIGALLLLSRAELAGGGSDPSDPLSAGQGQGGPPRARIITISDLDVETANVMGSIGAGMIAALLLHQTREERAAKDKFLNDVTHELKTPLCGIKTNAEILLSSALGDEQLRPAQRIQRQSESALKMVQQILDLAKWDAGRMPFEPMGIKAAGFVRGLTEEFASTARAKGMRIELCVKRDDALLWADEEQARIILRNLLSNAIEYGGNGGRVTVEVDVSPAGARLAVADTGVGIAPEDQERIFERFYRVRSIARPSVGGTGIGLSLVKELMEQHGGEVRVASELGHGSTFTIRFPTPPPGTAGGRLA